MLKTCVFCDPCGMSGTLVVDVEAGRESPWEAIERRYDHHALEVTIGFRRGNAVASSAWPEKQRGVGNFRRATLELPYFNLADGEKTKSAPLLIEIILCESRKKHLTRSSIGRRNGENSCLPPARPRMTNSSDGHHRLRRDSPGSLKILAVGTIDVQTWLAKRRNTSAEDPESEQISLLVAKGGVDTPLAFAPPESVFVWVRLAFSKAFLPDRLEEMLPVAFVVATTLFDCAVTIEEAELQLYARDGDTGDMSCVSRGRGGKIVVHENFEWNLTADTSLLLAESQHRRSSLAGPALIILLCDRAPKAIDIGAPCLSMSRGTKIIGCAEFSSEELLAYGATGRWHPLQACSVGWERWHGRGTPNNEGRSIVGEALIAFAWIARSVSESLSRITVPNREVLDRYRRQHDLRQLATSNNDLRQSVASNDDLRQSVPSNEDLRQSATRNDAYKAPCIDGISVRGPPAGHASSPRNMSLAVFIHVWDALLPRVRPECALYLTVKVNQRGSLKQRVSTKPAHGQSELIYTISGTTFPSSKDGESPLYFVWNEHLSLSVDVGEDPIIGFQLRDASVDHRTGNAVVAESDAEPFGSFTARSRLCRENEWASSEGNSSCRGKIAPVVMHRLRLVDQENGDRGGAGSECFEVVKVRMSSLVLTTQDAENDEVEAFRRQNADISQVPRGETLDRSLSGGSTESIRPESNPPRLAFRKPAQSRLLLDVSAAGDLFRTFAASGPSATGATQDSAELVQSEARGNGESTLKRGSTGKRNVNAGWRRNSELTITKNQLALIEREYFPGYESQIGCNTGAGGFQKMTEVFHDPSSMLTFRQFLSWLQGVPRDVLGTAGFLVSPRTALDHTEAVMDESAKHERVLAASLDRAGAPGKGLVGGWCSISLESTGQAAAHGRVQLGCEEAAKGLWEYHTRMLRNDVRALRVALMDLEGRINKRSDRSVSDAAEELVASWRHHSSSSVIYCVENVNAAGDETTEDSCEPWAMGDGEPLVALYLEQEASSLAAAAAHLKEVLRCAGDTICRDITRVSTRSSLTKNICLNVRDSRKRSWTDDGRKRASGNRLRRLYNVLLHHIKLVKGLYTEITALRRRASSALPLDMRGKMRPFWIHGDSARNLGVESDTGAPRSALSLVRRIRQAQEAARPAAVIGEGEKSRYAFLRYQTPEGELSAQTVASGGCIPSSKQMPVEIVLRSHPNSRDGQEPLRVSLPSSLGDSEPPNSLPVPQRSLSPDKVAIRLALARNAFKESGVELPNAFLDMSAEGLIKIARGSAYNGRGESLDIPGPAVAVCCPINRFILHVFRTAGGAPSGGGEVFSDVQELVATGGLDTNASDNSLWALAAKAGIVDVDRWVVAAMLWHVVDTVEEEAKRRARCSDTSNYYCPCTTAEEASVVSSSAASGGGHPGSRKSPEEGVLTGRDSRGGSGENNNPEANGEQESLSANRKTASLLAATKARSLWEEVRHEAFRLVISDDADFDLSVSSGDISLSSLPRGAMREYKNNDPAIRKRQLSAEDDPEYLWWRFAEYGSFDHALRMTLVQAGRRGSKPTYVALHSIVVCEMRMELQLLYTYAVAGFAEDSGLDLKDIVDAVRVRRARASSKPCSPVPACAYCPRTSTKKESGITREPQLTTEWEKAAVAPEANAEEECRHRHRKMTMMEEQQLVIGVPPELQELFRAATLAQDLRTQHRKEGEQSRESCALQTAETQVVRVLDGNRTLESAAFAGGKTALHHAAARGDEFLVRLLLERGCKLHLKDFNGKRACDLTRSLECLRLLGVLKRAPEPLALSLRPRAGVLMNRYGTNASRAPPPLRQGGDKERRAMIGINFSVSFRLVRAPSASCRDAEETSPLEAATTTWIRGVGRWFDVRNKVMYVDYGRERSGTTDSDNRETNSTCPGGQGGLGPSNGGTHYQACHALDVVLTSCLSPRGAELFNQLQSYAVSWKTSLAAEVLCIAIDAAAEIGAWCRFVFHEVAAEVVFQVAGQAFEEEWRVSSTGSFDEAHASTVARNGAPMACPDQSLVVATDEGETQLQSPVTSTSTSTESTPARRGLDKLHAARKLYFRCLAIVSVPHDDLEGRLGAAITSRAGDSEQGRYFVIRLTVEGGVCVVEMNGSSYLGEEAEIVTVDLEGRDGGVQRVLEYHGVSLTACVQTFDVMQDMEQPGMVLDMLATSICQLSSRFIAEGVDFPSLDQSAQDVLKAHVREHLRHATRRCAEAEAPPDWVLKVTMPAYGGVASVCVSGGTTGDEGGGLAELLPSEDGGWFRPEDVIKGLRSPQDDSCSTLPSLPPSAVNLVVALMGRNPCEVLSSLCPGTGADGQFALVGRTSEGFDGLGGNGRDRFRCSLEVAWDMKAEGISVRRFVMEEDEKCPRFSLRAVGVQNFSITQLPVSLDDIQAVWDQDDNEEAPVASEETSIGSEDVPVGSKEVRSEQSQVPSEQAPIGSEEVSIGSEQAPVTSEQAPIGSEEVSIGSEQAPVASEEVPVGSEEAPFASEKFGSEQAPVGSEQAPYQTRRTSAKETTNTTIAPENNPEFGQDPRFLGTIPSPMSKERGSIITSTKPRTTASVKAVTHEKRHGSLNSNDRTSPDEDDGQPMCSRELSKSNRNEKRNDIAITDQANGIDKSGSSSTDSGSDDGMQEVCDIQLSAEGKVESGTNSDKIMRSEGVSKLAETREDRSQQGVVKQETIEDDQEKSDQPHCRGWSGVNPMLGGVSKANSTDNKVEVIHAPSQLKAEVMTNESSVQIIDNDTPEQNLTPEVMDEFTKFPTLVDTYSTSITRNQSQQPDMPVPHCPVGEDSKPDSIPVEPRVGESLEGAQEVVTKRDMGPSTTLNRQPLMPGSMVERSLSVRGEDPGHAEAITVERPVIMQTVSQTGASTASLSEEKGIDNATGLLMRAADVPEESLADLPGFRVQTDEGSVHCKDTVIHNVGNTKGAIETLGVVRADQVANEEDEIERSGKIGQDIVSSKLEIARSGAEESTPEGSQNGIMGKEMVSNPLQSWPLPASFQALVELSAGVSDALVVKCSVLGEIALREHSDRGRCWQSLKCTYKIPAEGNTLRQDINLEDDTKLDRLEHLLAERYGLTLEDVVERFPLDIDLSSGGAVIRSFAHSICELRQFDDEGHEHQFDNVYKAVGHALRRTSEWEEIEVEVADFRVKKVKVLGCQKDDGRGNNEDMMMATQRTTAVNILCEDCLGIATPQGLKTHVAAAGVSESVMVLLEKAGFFSVEAPDVAGVFAALAEEWRRLNSGEISPSPEAATNDRSNLPAMLYSTTKRRRICFVTDDGSTRSKRSCCISASGTPDDFVLEITLGDPADRGSCGNIILGEIAASARVSCLRARDTPSQRSTFPAAATSSVSPSSSQDQGGHALGGMRETAVLRGGNNPEDGNGS